MGDILKRMGNTGIDGCGTGTGIGLALGGGVLYTVAEVGVYRVLEQEGIRICAVAGTSGGAMVGAAIAAGLPADEIIRATLKLRWHDLAWPIPGWMGLADGRPLARWVERLAGKGTIEELGMPFTAVATDITTGAEVRISRGPLGQAVQASSAIPGFFKPVRRGEELLVDGGITDNVPVSAVRIASPRIVLAVDVLRFFEGPHPTLRFGVDVLLKSYQEMVGKISQAQERNADLVVMPDLSGCSFLRFGDSARLIERGEEAMRAQMPRLRELIAERERGTTVAWQE